MILLKNFINNIKIKNEEFKKLFVTSLNKGEVEVMILVLLYIKGILIRKAPISAY